MHLLAVSGSFPGETEDICRICSCTSCGMRSSRERGQPAGKKLAEFHCTGGYSGDIHMPVSGENIRKSNSGTAVYGTCGGCGTGRICHIPDV